MFNTYCQFIRVFCVAIIIYNNYNDFVVCRSEVYDRYADRSTLRIDVCGH